MAVAEATVQTPGARSHTLTQASSTSSSITVDVVFPSDGAWGNELSIWHPIEREWRAVPGFNGRSGRYTITGLTPGVRYTIDSVYWNHITNARSSVLRIDVTPPLPPAWSTNPTTITFANATVGYNTQATRAITINNTGTVALTGISASMISGGTAFEIVTAPASSVSAGGSNNSLTIRPRTGLAVGTHTGTVRITTGNGNPTTRNVTLSFTVTAAPPTQGTEYYMAHIDSGDMLASSLSWTRFIIDTANNPRRWIFQDAPGNGFFIRPFDSARYLTATSSTAFALQDFTGNTNQIWDKISAPGGGVFLRSRAYGTRMSFERLNNQGIAIGLIRTDSFIPVREITIDDDIVMLRNSTHNLNFNITPSNAFPFGHIWMEYTSSNRTLATISETGVITAHNTTSPAFVRITVRNRITGVEATTRLRVVEDIVELEARIYYDLSHLVLWPNDYDRLRSIHEAATRSFLDTFAIRFYLPAGAIRLNTALDGSNCPANTDPETLRINMGGICCITACGKCRYGISCPGISCPGCEEVAIGGDCHINHHRGASRLNAVERHATIYTYRVVGHRLCFFGRNDIAGGYNHRRVGGVGNTPGRNSTGTSYNIDCDVFIKVMQHELGHNLSADHHCTPDQDCIMKPSANDGFLNEWCDRHVDAIFDHRRSLSR